VAQPGSAGTARAFRVGRRILLGGKALPAIRGLRFEVQTGAASAGGVRELTLGPPQILAVDLANGSITWSWGGMGSMPNLPGMGAVFGKTYPMLRVVRSESGTTFEGEWYVPPLGGGEDGAMRLLVCFDAEPHPGPKDGFMEADPESAVDLPAR
jgi:hypothetical protein